MRFWSKLLPFALVSGFIALVASLVPLAATSANTQLQVTEKTTVNLGGVMKLFVHNKTTESTITYSDKRIRTESADNASIVQCDLKRLITVNKKDKTYTTTPFGKILSSVAARSGAKPVGEGSMSVKIDEKPDSQTQTILGMTAHHVVDTITATGQGTGQCANYQLSMTVDEWYADYKIPFSCPNGPAAQPLAQQGNPCMQNFQVQASSKRFRADRLALKTSISNNLMGTMMTVETEATAVNPQPYDASLFDIPSGYIEKQP